MLEKTLKLTGGWIDGQSEKRDPTIFIPFLIGYASASLWEKSWMVELSVFSSHPSTKSTG